MSGEPLIQTSREGDWLVVAWDGDVDMANAASVEMRSLQGMENTDIGLTVDLTNVGYIDSAGIRTLIAMHRQLAERQQRLSLILPAGSTLKKALEVGGVTTVIPTYPSADEARAAR